MKLRHLLAVAAVAAFAATPARAADKLTVLLDWYLNPDHAPLVIAQEKGYFARHGLDVDLVVASDAAAPPKLVAAGQAEVAITYQSDLMLQQKEDLPTVRFGTLVNTPLNCLIALKDGPVKTLADLKGKTVGYSIASFEDAYLNAILGSVGLSVADVTTVNLNFNLVAPLLAGQVDAILGGYRNVEFIQIELEGYPATAWFPEEHGVPAYDELIYITRDSLVADPRLPRFLAAIKEATAFLDTNPDEALAIFMRSHADLDDELNRRSFIATLPLFARDPAHLDRERYTAFADFLKDRGLIETVPPLDTFAVELPAGE